MINAPKFTLLLPLVCGSLCLAADTGSATVQGTVVAQTGGAAVAGAIVTALRTAVPPARGTAKSGVDGAFAIQGLVAGTYKLCVQVPGGTYVNPCDWSASPQTVTVTAGQKVTGVSIKLATGSVVKVRVQDASKLLTQKTAAGNDPQMMLGVWGRGQNNLFHPARLAARDSSGADYQVVVPRDTPLALAISSNSVALADNKGAALVNNKDQSTFKHATGDANPPSFTYTVTGKRP